MLSSLSLGISNLVHLFDPEIVVIIGDFLDGGEDFLDPLREMVRAQAISRHYRSVEIRLIRFTMESQL
jgi:predicted NBD/HSP70 family sugar kinase